MIKFFMITLWADGNITKSGNYYCCDSIAQMARIVSKNNDVCDVLVIKSDGCELSQIWWRKE